MTGRRNSADGWWRRAMQQSRVNSVAQLRRLLGSPSMLLLPTAHDPLSAWLTEMAGFEAVLVSRQAVGMAVYANDEPDVVDDELLIGRAAEVCRLVSIPVVVDLSPVGMNVRRLRRTVAALASSGVAGVIVDDEHPDQLYDEAAAAEAFRDRMVGVRESLSRFGLDLVTIARTVAVTQVGATPIAALTKLFALDPAPDLGMVDGLDAAGLHSWAGGGSVSLMHLESRAVDDESAVREAERSGFVALAWSTPLVSPATAAMQASLASRNSSQVTEATSIRASLPVMDPTDDVVTETTP